MEQEEQPAFEVVLIKQAEKELFSLPALLQAKTLDLIDDLKMFGNELGEPQVKSMRNGLLELRATAPDGISRSFFFFTSGKKAYIVHIFQKKTQKTPKHNLDLALERMKKVKEELNR
ncbi:type II toxin-antitoxin system RelE/ParE family toxin [[Haemophilus] felis]|nr:type II toxin-antitoxin system RelE/ParE family toxin [[Haemophilus] felis]